MECEGGGKGLREDVRRPLDDVRLGRDGKNEEGRDITPPSSLEPRESGDHVLK